MEASSELVGVILLTLIAISLATIVHGVVISTLPEPENPEFTPPPDILKAEMKVIIGDVSYTELNLELTSCKGIKDTYVTLIGYIGADTKEIVGSAPLDNCVERRATLILPAPSNAYDRYTAYLSKYGVRSEEVNVAVTTETASPPPG